VLWLFGCEASPCLRARPTAYRPHVLPSLCRTRASEVAVCDLRRYTSVICLCLQVVQLSCEHGAELMLNKEARKWSAKVVRDMRSIRSTTKQINDLMDQIKTAQVSC